ncbi:type 4 pilus assembly PilZ [Desulfurella amilsii]|uniref:Type 4 pilus assembly PilZ n=1 Tax=Desulfurella amilsii TaxID=1562698 RepID=A0A1X4XZE8_9BACT|nr:flagellar brake protein [Desulfurella amilsii]OSS42921.1 type 4 pilus assembly PilZ [Desulfurella amilsii]
MEKEKVFAKNIKEIIDVGQNISLEIPSGDYRGVYYSYVYDEDDNHFYILLPTDSLGRAAFLRAGDSVTISCISKKNIRVGFETKVLQVIKDDKTLYKISKPTEFYKYEFRENFRVDVLINAKCYFYDHNQQLQTRQTRQTSILSLSASGAKISLNEYLELNKHIIIEFTLENQTFNLDATIVRRSEIDKSTFHYGLKFEDINQKDKDFLIRFCLKKQMEFLRMQRG